MKVFLIISFFQILSYSAHSLNVTIISSQSNQTGQPLDSLWSDIVLKMGHIPKIVPQSTLDNELLFDDTDILIISNAEIGLSSVAENSILQFIKSGKPVYIQSEYLPAFTTNQAFEFVINSLGGTFKWNKLFEDYMEMKVLGSYNNTNNIVDSVRFWFSVSGIGDCNTINFLEFGGAYHGFQYIPVNPSYGSILTTSDQDWILEHQSPKLMENIITHLISPPLIPDENKLNLGNDTTLCIGETLILDASTAKDNFKWQDNSNFPTIRVTGEGIYWVTANLDCGIASDTVVIDTKDCDCFVYIPNIFTPNRGNVNDFFSVQSNCQFAEFSLSIFDRWGELLFGTYDYQNSWDGTFKGNLSPSGVYTILLKYKFIDGQRVQNYGNLTLIR